MISKTPPGKALPRDPLDTASDVLRINRAYYERHAAKFFRNTARIQLDDVYEPFLSRLPKGARILDAGCGTGRDCLSFIKRGFKVTMLDASPAMVRIATKLTGHECVLKSFEEMDYLDEFDGIWACASLLHVRRSDLPNVLLRFAMALKIGGVLYISVKEGQGERISDGRFFSYFCPEELSQLVSETTKFEVLNVWSTQAVDSSGINRPWINLLAQRIEA